MSINTAPSPNSCYEVFGFIDGDECLPAKPSRELFVENLNRLLDQRKMKPAQLATALGIHRAVVHGWVRGRYHPEQKFYDEIADALGVPVSRLFQDSSDFRETIITLDTALEMVSEAVKKAKSLE